MRIPVLVLGLVSFLLVLLLASPLEARPKKPHDILLDLKHTYILLGERQASPEKAARAEEEAAQAILAFAHDGGDAALLIERDNQGMTPLIAASFEGFDAVVAALLTLKPVVDHKDDVDNKGLSAWVYANFAMKQGMWVCNPTLAANPYAMAPLKAVQAFYDDQISPYRVIRDLLGHAGARGGQAQAQSLWMSLCRMSSTETQKKVIESSDLLKTVLAEGKRTRPWK